MSMLMLRFELRVDLRPFLNPPNKPVTFVVKFMSMSECITFSKTRSRFLLKLAAKGLPVNKRKTCIRKTKEDMFVKNRPYGNNKDDKSRLLDISPSHFGLLASFIGPKNEMYCDVLSDQMIFYRKIQWSDSFRNSV